MAIFILLVAALVFFFGTSAGKIPGQVGMPISLICFVFTIICLFLKPKYQKRELLCSAQLLPIVDGVYAIKTCKNKILCKYVDFEDKDKVKIDLLTIDVHISRMPDGEKPTFYMYERKLKRRWMYPSYYPNIYMGILSIPEGSVISE